MNKDTVTTVLGGLMAVGTAVSPVMSGVQGTMDRTDYVQLVVAILTAVFGFFTNKEGDSNG